jgi:hypothetical protein
MKYYNKSLPSNLSLIRKPNETAGLKYVEEILLKLLAKFGFLRPKAKATHANPIQKPAVKNALMQLSVAIRNCL